MHTMSGGEKKTDDIIYMSYLSADFPKVDLFEAERVDYARRAEMDDPRPKRRVTKNSPNFEYFRALPTTGSPRGPGMSRSGLTVVAVLSSRRLAG